MHTGPKTGFAGVEGGICTKHQGVAAIEFVIRPPAKVPAQAAKFSTSIGDRIFLPAMVANPRERTAPPRRKQARSEDMKKPTTLPHHSKPATAGINWPRAQDLLRYLLIVHTSDEGNISQDPAGMHDRLNTRRNVRQAYKVFHVCVEPARPM
jgi:hypothetical protein